MFFKKNLLTLFMLSLNFYSKPNNPKQQNMPIHEATNTQNNETAELLKKQIAQNDIIIALLSESLRLEKERKKAEEQNRLFSIQLKNAQIKSAQEESEKGFSLPDCVTAFISGLFGDLTWRESSLEFSELLGKNIKKMLMQKALSATLGIPDVVVGDFPARYGYNNAAIYPMTFLESNSLEEYRKLRKQKIQAFDPRVQALKEKDDQALAAANTTTTLLDAQSRSQQISRRIAEEDPQFAEQSTKAHCVRIYKHHQANHALATEFDELLRNSRPQPNPNVEVVNDPDTRSSSSVSTRS